MSARQSRKDRCSHCVRPGIYELPGENLDEDDSKREDVGWEVKLQPVDDLWAHVALEISFIRQIHAQDVTYICTAISHAPHLLRIARRDPGEAKVSDLDPLI